MFISTAVYFYQAVMRNENFAGPCASFSSCFSLLLLPRIHKILFYIFEDYNISVFRIFAILIIVALYGLAHLHL